MTPTNRATNLLSLPAANPTRLRGAPIATRRLDRRVGSHSGGSPTNTGGDTLIDGLHFASSVTVGGFEWTGDFTTVDLIAASTNALNGALLARRPDHYKQFTIVGIILMAILGGLGGGITRDVLVGEVPAAITNPAYILLAVTFGFIGYKLAYAGGQLFREGIFQFMTAFSLPWYAIVGAQKGVNVGLPCSVACSWPWSAPPPGGI